MVAFPKPVVCDPAFIIEIPPGWRYGALYDQKVVPVAWWQRG